jgi:hypothetical protein
MAIGAFIEHNGRDIFGECHRGRCVRPLQRGQACGGNNGRNHQKPFHGSPPYKLSAFKVHLLKRR